MSDVQDKWNEYYSDKVWIDTKGWCHLDGTPYTDRDFERRADKRVSLIKTILKTILYLIILSVATALSMMLFYENTHNVIFLIFFVMFHYLIIRCVWIVIKNLFKRNLKLW